MQYIIRPGHMTRRAFAQGIGLATAFGASATRTRAAALPRRFKTVSVNHLSYRCPDYTKARDFYISLLGVESAMGTDTGKEAHLMFGPAMGGTYLVPRLPNPDTVPRPWPQPPRGWIESIGYTLTNWDAMRVRAMLEARGLKPVEEGESFRITDPFGMSVSLCSPRMTAFGLGPAAAGAAGGNPKAALTNHIIYGCADYKRAAAGYADIMGMVPVPGSDSGSETKLSFYPRGETPMNAAAGTPSTFLVFRNSKAPPVAAARIDHIAYTIADWDTDGVRAELNRRGLPLVEDHEHSFHVPDAFAYDLQISGLQMNAYTG